MSPEPSAAAVVVLQEGGFDVLSGVAVPLIAAFLGAAFGGFMTYWVQHRLGSAQVERLRRGAARVVYMEVQSNLATILTARDGHARGPLRRNAWDSEMGTLAEWLPPDELLQVSNAYLGLPAYDMENDLQRHAAVVDLAPYHALMTNLEARIVPGLVALRARAFTDSEVELLAAAATAASAPPRDPR